MWAYQQKGRVLAPRPASETKRCWGPVRGHKIDLLTREESNPGLSAMSHSEKSVLEFGMYALRLSPTFGFPI